MSHNIVVLGCTSPAAAYRIIALLHAWLAVHISESEM
jgi:hypothetical protein